MAAYKDEARGTWYISFHYNDWTGKNKRKLAWLSDEKGGIGIRAEVSAAAGNKSGYEV